MVCSTVFGDGAKLLGIRPPCSVPHYYVILIDSKWTDLRGDEFYDFLDELYEAIGDEFVEHHDDCEDCNESNRWNCEHRRWPVLDLENGSRWFAIKD